MVQDNNDIRPVEELYEALNRQDAEAFDQIVTDDVEFVDFSLDETLRGREALKNYFKNWWTAFPQGTGKIRNRIVSGDQVVIEVLGQGVQSGPFETSRGRIAATQRAFDFHFCQIFTIRGGKIASGRSYSDASKLLATGSSARLVA